MKNRWENRKKKERNREQTYSPATLDHLVASYNTQESYDERTHRDDIYGVGGSEFNCWRVGGSRVLRSCCSCFTWMYLECVCSLTCPPSLWRYQLPGFSSALVDLLPLVPPWMTASHFLAGEREVELKPTTFSSLLLSHVFLSFLFSWTTSNIVPLSVAWSYSLMVIIIIIIIIPLKPQT